MAEKLDVKQGTLDLMILRTLEVLGPLHGYRGPHRETQPQPPHPQLRHPLPGAPQARAGGVHRRGVAPVREQPPRQVLHAHRHGPQTAGAGGPRVAQDRRSDRRLSWPPTGGPMRYLRAALARIAGFFTGHRADAELREELESHLEMETAENIRRGMAPEAARRRSH